MANTQYYCITKKGKSGDIVYFDYEKLSGGYDIKPRNSFSYEGIKVNKLIIIKQSFIEKVLRRKVKKKLELYLQYVIDLLDSDDETDDGVLSEVLNDLIRYRDIIQYKYNKYLNKKYVELMIKKIGLLEYELKLKMMNQKQQVKEEVIDKGKGR